MTDASAIGLVTAFAAGTVSFLSPCLLPVVPGYVSYIGGGHPDAGSVAGLAVSRLVMLRRSSLFVLGFGAVFIVLGAGATALGSPFLRYRYEANVVSGLVIIAFGLFMLGALRRLTRMHGSFRLDNRLPAGHPAGPVALGVAFGFGWTPCVGPILGAILTYGATQGSLPTSLALLTAYAMGLGLPFLLSAVFLRELMTRYAALRRLGQPLQRLGGVVMVLFGALVLTDRLTVISYWLLEHFPALGRIG